MDELVTNAKIFATQAHRRINQLRKYSSQPYDVHLKAVEELVRTVTDDTEMIAAAWLHDVVEDTPATLDEIERTFGSSVAALVEQLTDVSRPSSGNRGARRAIDREHTARASSRAKTIKLADLIDNCRDICKHDRRFASTFLAEMAALLEVLGDGDPRLYRKAVAVLGECSERLGLGKTRARAASRGEEDHPLNLVLRARHTKVLNRFARTFSADDLAEALHVFEADISEEEVRRVTAGMENRVAGVRNNGSVSGYLRARDLLPGSPAASYVPFRDDQVVESKAPLADVIEILTRHDYCFVSRDGRVDGVIDRADVQKPVARMWLFGLITMTELYLTERLRELWPDDSWTRLLSPGRLAQAEQLRSERLRRQQTCSLLDCLQLADKGAILLQNPVQLNAFGFESKRAGQLVIKELQSLRNNLAHAQDIVTNDWPQIVRLSRRLESLISDS
jgi:hypothetical protein